MEVVAGFAVAVLGGIALGVLIHFSNFARRTVYPLVTALQSMPKIALAPLMIVWFGYGFASKIAATFLFAFFPIVVSTLGGLSSTPQSLDEHFRALGATRLDAFWRVRAPAALPTLELTGRGAEHWPKDTSLARRAPVQRLVRRRPAVASTYSQSFFNSNSSIL